MSGRVQIFTVHSDSVLSETSRLQQASSAAATTLQRVLVDPSMPLGRLDAAVVQATAGHRHRIVFIQPGTMAITRVMLVGHSWTDEDRAAAKKEAAELNRRDPD